MEELKQETERWEGTVPPLGSPLGQWCGPLGGLDVDLGDGEVTLQGGGDGDLVSQCSGLQAPSSRGGCWSSPQHTHSWTKVGYPED